jgi:ferredoxin-NADP reductase
MAMIRTREAAGSRAPFRLVYSLRSPDAAFYTDELAIRQHRGDGLDVTYVYTRAAPPGSPLPAGRISAGVLASYGWPSDRHPAVFVCGPTGFVETVANLLVSAGHDPRFIKTERFGPSGGQ